MIERITRYNLNELMDEYGFSINNLQGLDELIFLDMEHYIYRKPIALGIFGAAVLEGNELVCTQYFLENKKDLKGLVKTSYNYLNEKQKAGHSQLVAFAAKNDLNVLHTMFRKFRLRGDLREEFKVVDLQSEFKKAYAETISLEALEGFAEIHRQGPSISGSTIAKTFANIVGDADYIHRMPKEKMVRLLDYNRMDVVNLFLVMANWDKISLDAVNKFKEGRLMRRMKTMKAFEQDPLD